MSNIQVTLQMLMHRVNCLEECNRLKDDQILKLQADVARSSLCADGGDSFVVTVDPNEFRQMEERVKQLEGLVNGGRGRQVGDGAEAKQLSGPEDASKNFTSRLDLCQDSMDKLTCKVSANERVNKRLEDTLIKMEDRMDSLSRTILSTEDVTKSLDTRMRDKERQIVNLKNTLDQTKTQMDSLLQRVTDIERVSRSLEKRMCDMEGTTGNSKNTFIEIKKQIDANKECMDTLKICLDPMEKTAFHVMLGFMSSTQLTSNVPTRLDCCCGVELRSQHLNVRTAYFTAPIEGSYLFCLTVCQMCHGRLDVAVRTDDEDQPYIVRTYVREEWPDVKLDSRSGSIMLSLAKGARVGVYVHRLNGEAKVRWCKFGGCLLSSHVSH